MEMFVPKPPDQSQSPSGGKVVQVAVASEVAAVNEWISQQVKHDILRIVACGSVCDGKSTLIGRLLWESKQVSDDLLSVVQTDSARHGIQDQDINFALLVDEQSTRREQGLAKDVAYCFISTPQRTFIVADAPGCEQYIRNSVARASVADVAVMVIDAQRGVLAETRRLAYLVSLTGIQYVILVVNKMDQVGYRQDVFDAIVAAFNLMTKSLAFASVTSLPISALKGDNVTSRSVHMRWFQGPTLMASLEAIEVQPPSQFKVVFLLDSVSPPNANFREISGTLVSGQLAVGDAVRFTASGQTAMVTQIIAADEGLKIVKAGGTVTLVLDREVDASPGDVIALADQPLEMTDQFEATLVWMHGEPGFMGCSYELKLADQWASASIKELKYRVDVDTLAHESCTQMVLNDIAVANIMLSKSLVFEPYSQSNTLGGFILVDKLTRATVAVGMIRHNLRRAQNVHRQRLSISREDRERLNGHKGKVIWFTGLSGSGKSTIANALEKELNSRGRHTYILDGDNVRQGLNRDLGFTDSDRVENIRRVAEVAKLMMDAGLIVMTAFISPFRAEREMARELIGEDRFVEVYVDTPLDVCEQRDPKGLYKKARSGQLPNMTGIDSPYEVPSNPALRLDPSLPNPLELLLQQVDIHDGPPFTEPV